MKILKTEENKILLEDAKGHRWIILDTHGGPEIRECERYNRYYDFPQYLKIASNINSE